MANANSNASARGQERSANPDKNKIVITGVDFIEADEAGNGKFEPSTGDKYDGLLSSLIAQHGVEGTIDRLSINGSLTDTIAFVWDHLDDNYSYYNTAINDAFIDLGIIYAQHLLKDGEALTDLTAKFSADNADAGTVPQRDQSLHDNILGNFDELSIVDKFGANATEQFDKIFDAGLGGLLGQLGNYTDGRDYYGGFEGEDATASRTFDSDFFML